MTIDTSTLPTGGFPIITEAQIGATTVQTVDARELHAFLGVGRDFTTWIKERLAAYGFTEGADFVMVLPAPQNGGVGNRGARTDFALTLDTAKELAMVERTERGRQARRYFIECERRLREVSVQVAPKLPQSLPEALRLAADLAERNAEQAKAIAVLAPKAAALDTLADTEGTFCIRDAAKALGEPEKLFRAYLTQHGWIYRRGRNEPWVARAERLTADHMRTKVVQVETSTGPWNRPQARITSRGLALLATRLGKPVPAEAQQHLAITTERSA